jgi:hypothetical protein
MAFCARAAAGLAVVVKNAITAPHAWIQNPVVRPICCKIALVSLPQKVA